MSRVWSYHRNRSKQGNSKSHPEHQTRRGARFSRRRIRRIAERLASSLRPQRDRYQCSLRRITEGSPDFVIEGEKRSGDYTDEDYEYHRWYGVRGFFRWLESK